MSTLLKADHDGYGVGYHDIDPDISSFELRRRTPGGVIYEDEIHVDLWNLGDRVMIRAKDGSKWFGRVIMVDHVCRVAIIKLIME